MEMHTKFTPFLMVLGSKKNNGYACHSNSSCRASGSMLSFTLRCLLECSSLVPKEWLYIFQQDFALAHIQHICCYISLLIWNVVKTNQQFHNTKDLLKATKNSNHLIQSCKLLLTLHRSTVFEADFIK